MKVLVISHMYPSSFNEIGGIFVHEQVKALVAKGVEIQVISPVPWTPFPIKYLSKKWKKYSEIPIQANWDGVEVYYPRNIIFPKSWFFASSGKRMYLGIKDLVAKIYKEFQFDLIHAHVALPDGFAALKLKQIYNKPVIVTIHGQDLYLTINRNKSCKIALINVYKKVDRIILVSKKLKEISDNNLGFASKSTVIGNGVAVKNIQKAKNIMLDESTLDSRVILSVSYLITRKAIDFNLKAIAQLINKYPNLKYLIIGDGLEMRRLKELSSNLRISKHVEFLGQLPHEKVLAYMSKADIFSLPSWNEAFGVIYIEAMAHGKPVIGCKGEGIEDFVEDGKTGILVKPKDVDSLVEAMDYLLSNPDEADAIGERGRKLVLENYIWEKNAEKTIEVYREVLNNAC
ncbi:MAG TPA: glycosyltransferase family 4 protein [Atribacterota bacterium]|nr:glycosyltransferase family 4 protein [Atribacterota bacterium]